MIGEEHISSWESCESQILFTLLKWTLFGLQTTQCGVHNSSSLILPSFISHLSDIRICWTDIKIAIMTWRQYSIPCGIERVADLPTIPPLVFPSEISLHCYGSGNSMEFLSGVDAWRSPGHYYFSRASRFIICKREVIRIVIFNFGCSFSTSIRWTSPRHLH